MRSLTFLISVSGLFPLTACLTVDKPVFVDRHTMMEEDASGEWPDLEASFQQEGIRANPLPYENLPDSEKKKRIHRILDGDLSFKHPDSGAKKE